MTDARQGRLFLLAILRSSVLTTQARGGSIEGIVRPEMRAKEGAGGGRGFLEDASEAHGSEMRNEVNGNERNGPLADQLTVNAECI